MTETEVRLLVMKEKEQILRAMRDVASIVAHDANSSIGELALLMGVLVTEMRTQHGFDTTIIEKHLMDRLTKLQADPTRGQAAATLRAFEKCLRQLGPDTAQ